MTSERTEDPRAPVSFEARVNYLTHSMFTLVERIKRLELLRIFCGRIVAGINRTPL